MGKNAFLARAAEAKKKKGKEEAVEEEYGSEEYEGGYEGYDEGGYDYEDDTEYDEYDSEALEALGHGDGDVRCGGLRRNHVLTLAATGGVVFGIVNAIGTGEVLVLGVTYVVYLLVALVGSKMLRQMTSKWDADDAMEALRTAADLPGFLRVSGVAYHYKKSGSNNKKKKVVTASAEVQIVPDRVIDISKPPHLEAYPRAFVDVVVRWDFANTRSDVRMKRWIKRWRDREGLYDKHVDISKDWRTGSRHGSPYDVVPQSMLTINGDSSCLLSPTAMVLFSVFLLAWPYMMYVERTTIRVRAYIAKKIRFTKEVRTARSSWIEDIDRERSAIIRRSGRRHLSGGEDYEYGEYGEYGEYEEYGEDRV